MGRPKGRRRSCFEFLSRGNDAFPSASDEGAWIQGLAEGLDKSLGLIGMLDRDKHKGDIDTRTPQLVADGQDQFISCRLGGAVACQG